MIPGTPPPLRLRVKTRFDASSAVAGFVLEHPDGAWLPGWEPGAHIDMELPGGLRRQYSLCSDPADRGTYRIAVLREQAGRGGSEWIHEHLTEGDIVEIHGPRNNFELVDGSCYHFVAGGVGITAILPMVRHCAARGADWRLTYLGHSRRSMAFLDELEAFGERVRIHSDEESGRLDAAELLTATDTACLVYACGPETLLDALEKATAEGPGNSLHVERFSPKDPGALTADGDVFTVTFARSGITAEVPSVASILDTAEEHGVQVDFSCREGTCGTCEVDIVAGSADHRDSVLSPEEQQAGETMMICVSRARTRSLVIDL